MKKPRAGSWARAGQQAVAVRRRHRSWTPKHVPMTPSWSPAYAEMPTDISGLFPDWNAVLLEKGPVLKLASIAIAWPELRRLRGCHDMTLDGVGEYGTDH